LLSGLYQGATLQLAEKSAEAVFVSGHGFSRAENAAKCIGL
jgi:hypothetical protein